MASREQAVPENVPGPYFVDTTCIDCDTCRQLAPSTFGEAGDYSFVQLQPRGDAERQAAARALVACPTGSIGGAAALDASAAADEFPIPIAGGVSYCGFNSPKSFGGNS